MKTGIRWMEHQFGITPLAFIRGGDGVSTSYPNHTSRLAARAGFGWFHTGDRSWRGYLGPDMAVRGWDFEGTMEDPLRVEAPPDGHDKGIAEHPEQFLRVFEEHPNVEWMGLNEYIGYIHAKLSGGGGKDLALQVSYDPHYCRYFRDHTSQWNLLLSDWLAKDLGRSTISVDGKTVIKNADLSKQLRVKIPAGVGVHNVRIK